MSEQGQGRYDRSRYGSSGDKKASSGRYHDRFFEDMRIDEPVPERSFSSRLRGGDARDDDAREPMRERTHFLDGFDEDRVSDATSNSVLDPDSGSGAETDAGMSSHRTARRGVGAVATSGDVDQSLAASDPEQADPAGSDESASQRDEREPRRQRRDFSRRAVEAEIAQGSRRNPQVSRAKQRDWRRIAAGVGIAAAVVVLVGGGVAAAWFTGIAGNLGAGVDDDLRAALVKTDMANEPFYMVLLGTDGSAERDGDAEFGGVYRSDSMMLARIDPVAKKATLISIPRDLLVELPDGHGEEKINAAYALGGPALAVKTVSKLAGVPISHYAQVDFDGFTEMVQALGGIEVDVPISFDDADAAGQLKAGLQVIDGYQALALCRMRNAYADIAAHPDEMRAANQRLVLSAIARKLLASDVATIAATVQAMSSYVTTDLELGDIIGLAQIMRGLDSETDIYTAGVPTTSQYIDEGWYEYLNKDDWKKMMERVESGEPPLAEAVVDEATGTVLATSGAGTVSAAAKQAVVTVKNATDTSGLAAKVRTKLKDAGFVNVVVGDITDSYSYPKTLVVYDEEGRAREADEIVAAIGQGETFENDGSYLLLDTDFMVVIGDDWQE